MNDQYLAYIANRIEKVTSALYRVTDLLHEKEPLKWEMRNKAVEIFSQLVSLQNRTILEKYDCLRKIGDLISQHTAIISFFVDNETASGINFKILKREYVSIKETIDQEKQKQNLTKIFWGCFPKKHESRLKLAIGHTNGQGNGQTIKQKTKRSDRMIKIDNNDQKNSQIRKNKIFEIMKEKKEVSIGEISAIFSQYSEKTIQRDLLEMVNSGILKKNGDKRWRKYALTR